MKKEYIKNSVLILFLSVFSAWGESGENFIPENFKEMVFEKNFETSDIGYKVEESKKYDYVDLQNIIPKKPLKIALEYYDKNINKIRNPYYLSIADFTQHSSQKRFYIIDMRTGKVSQFLVAHGKGSDPNHTGYATYFSNQESSHASSLGFYMTGETYDGKHGYSLYLDGLSSTNSNASERAVVIHGADYVSNGGRSFGCLAVEMSVRTKIIDMLKGGSIIYTYHEKFSRE